MPSRKATPAEISRARRAAGIPADALAAQVEVVEDDEERVGSEAELLDALGPDAPPDLEAAPDEGYTPPPSAQPPDPEPILFTMAVEGLDGFQERLQAIEAALYQLHRQMIDVARLQAAHLESALESATREVCAAAATHIHVPAPTARWRRIFKR